MHGVILAGGSGTRLWPLSREKFPKQYVQLDHSQKSLFQKTVLRVLNSLPQEKVIIITHKNQTPQIKMQLQAINVSQAVIIEEPMACNTAPAIGAAACYLEKLHGRETIMAVLPSDHLIPEEEQFAELLSQGKMAAEKYGLVTFGIMPTYPETGYGYIRTGEQLDQSTFKMERFVEKPNLELANQYLQDPRYFWNSGMFIFQVGHLLEQFAEHQPEMAGQLKQLDHENFTNIEEIYKNISPISIDYGIMEKSQKITVIPSRLKWSDLGNWQAIYEISEKDKDGNCSRGNVLSMDTKNSLIQGHSRLISTVGVSNLIVVDTPDALLICSRDHTQKVKEVVDRLKDEGRDEYIDSTKNTYHWGSCSLLAAGETEIKELRVNPQGETHELADAEKDQHLLVKEGKALLKNNEEKIKLFTGEHSLLPARTTLQIKNPGPEELIIILIS